MRSSKLGLPLAHRKPPPPNARALDPKIQGAARPARETLQARTPQCRDLNPPAPEDAERLSPHQTPGAAESEDVACLESEPFPLRSRQRMNASSPPSLYTVGPKTSSVSPEPRAPPFRRRLRFEPGGPSAP